jgi:hypothetical protein
VYLIKDKILFDKILKIRKHLNIGEFLVIEFSTKNNAMFIYQADQALLDMKYKSRRTTRLKGLSGSLGKHTHAGSWENTFDYELRRKLSQSVRYKSESK